MLDGEEKTRTDQKRLNGKVMVAAEKNGFFNSQVKLGQIINKGDLLGHIEPLLEEKAIEIKAPESGQIIYLRVEDSIGEGESVVHIAH